MNIESSFILCLEGESPDHADILKWRSLLTKRPAMLRYLRLQVVWVSSVMIYHPSTVPGRSSSQTQREGIDG